MSQVIKRLIDVEKCSNIEWMRNDMRMNARGRIGERKSEREIERWKKRAKKKRRIGEQGEKNDGEIEREREE